MNDAIDHSNIKCKIILRFNQTNQNKQIIIINNIMSINQMILNISKCIKL